MLLTHIDIGWFALFTWFLLLFSRWLILLLFLLGWFSLGLLLWHVHLSVLLTSSIWLRLRHSGHILILSPLWPGLPLLPLLITIGHSLLLHLLREWWSLLRINEVSSIYGNHLQEQRLQLARINLIDVRQHLHHLRVVKWACTTHHAWRHVRHLLLLQVTAHLLSSTLGLLLLLRGGRVWSESGFLLVDWSFTRSFRWHLGFDIKIRLVNDF